jgi:lipopolysaccharide transport system permease protein
LNDLKIQYAGSFFGVGWAVLTPLVLLAIYAAVYLIIFQIRISNLTPLQYILYMFAGLVPFLMTSEALVNGAGSVVANKAVWTNTVFPIDLAPVKSVLMSQIPMVVGLVVITYILLFTGTISWVSLLLPIVWGLHILFLIGLTWVLSLLTIILRDIRNVIALLMMALMILSPIAYTPDMVPHGLKILLVLNPLAYFIMAYQSILVLGQVPEVLDWIIMVAMSLTVFFLGSYFFGRAKAALIEYV